MPNTVAIDEPMSTKKRSGHSALARALLIVAALAVAPFVLGGIMLGLHAAKLPPAAGEVAKARILGAAVFSLGFAIAAVSSVYGLIARSSERRILGTAGVLLGCSQMALGIILRKTIEHEAIATAWSLIPIALPIVLWAVSAWLAFGTLRKVPRKPSAPTDSTTEEQPRLLLPP